MNYLSPVCARFASAYAVLLSAIDKLVGKPVLLFVSVWAVLLSVIDKLVGKPVMLFASVWVALLVVVLAPIPSVAFQVEEPETTDNGDLNHLRPEFFDTLRIDLTITTNADIIVRLRQYHPSANDRRTFFIPTHDPNGDINIRDVRVVIDDVPLTEVDNYDAQNNTFKVAGHGGLAIWPPRLWRDYPIDIGYTLSNAIVTDGTWAHAEGLPIGWSREYDGFIADIRVRYERSQNPERIHFIAQDGQIIGSNSRSEVGVATDGQVRFLMQTSIGSGVIHLVFPAQYIQSGAERTRFSRSPEEVLSRVEAAIEEEARQQAEVAERRQSGRTFGGFLFLLSLALSWLATRKSATWKKIDEESPKELPAPPANMPPALAGALFLNTNIIAGHILVTIFDLAERGYYSLRWSEQMRKGLLGEKLKKVLIIEKTGVAEDPKWRTWEKTLVHYLDQRLQNSGAALQDLITLNRVEIRKFYSVWERELRHDVRDMGWFRSNTVPALSFAAAQVLILLTVINSDSITGFHPAFTVGFVSIAGIVISLLTLKKYTDSGWAVNVHWKAYRTALENGSVSQDAGLFIKHVLYGTSMVIKRKAFAELFEQQKLLPADMTWFKTEVSGDSSDVVELKECIEKSTKYLEMAVSRTRESRR